MEDGSKKLLSSAVRPANLPHKWRKRLGETVPAMRKVHNCIGHGYIGHNYLGHNYIGSVRRCPPCARSITT